MARIRHRCCGLLLFCGLCISLFHPTRALEWQLFEAPSTRSPSPARSEFLAALLRPRIGSTSPEEAPAVNAGVRTRNTRTTTPETVTLVLGAEAARMALSPNATNWAQPMLLALLSYEEMLGLPAFPPGSRVAVLLRDAAPSTQLPLIDALLPQRRRVGVLVAPGSHNLLRDLQHSQPTGDRWALHTETAQDALTLAPTLRALLPRIDALLVLPDSLGQNQAAFLAVLHAAAAAGVPVIGPHEGWVRAGALAARVATPTQLAQQAHTLGKRLLSPNAPPVPLVAWAQPSAVQLNRHVARSLALSLPDAQALTQRLNNAAHGS